ncbi:MerC domain-containing protein [Aliidiomarina minuta]|uniref:MerC domain-containing protein n=1 Tax=Aliidiomarina minuta TaxID=880057 RepID=UPI0013009CEA|nr:MerC domain-containing protein [Aliidiomarina minuta]
MNKDLFGAWLSAICVCHCVLTPFILIFTSSGLLGVLFGSELFHWFMLAPVTIVVILSFPSAWRIHHNLWPGSLSFAGLALLLSALAFHGWPEIALTILGGSLLFSAHIMNRRLLLKANIGCGGLPLKNPDAT